MFSGIIAVILLLCTPTVTATDLPDGAVSAEIVQDVSWSFHGCLHDRKSVNDTCNEPEWRSEPVMIPFSSTDSLAMSLKLNLDGIDSDSKLNYNSPALEIIVEDVTGAAIDQEETYFTVQSDDYHRDEEELGDVLNTKHCGLPKKTEWTFDRAVPADERSSITVVFVITGNTPCSWFEIAKKFFEENTLLCIIGGSVFLLGFCCCYCCLCKAGCSLCDCLICFHQCFGCDWLLDCCGLGGCIGGDFAQKALELV
jgi:hypothetical protein